MLGDLSNRRDNFWNYWLNFCVSNKSAKDGRGGRGIGRVTFLIASEIQSVLGYTNTEEGNSAICGMAFLGVKADSEELRSTHAYLAESENGNIFNLHGEDTAAVFRKAFRLSEYAEENLTGLSLVVPYPKAELTPECVLAAAIQNFAPAIMDGSLVVKVNEVYLDSESILSQGTSEKVREHFRPGAIAEDPARYLNFLKDLCQRREFVRLSVSKEGSGKLSDAFVKGLRDLEPVRLSLGLGELGEVVEGVSLEDLQVSLKNEEAIFVEIVFPIRRNGVDEQVSLLCAVQSTPYSSERASQKHSIDSFFREGMLLPKVVASGQGGDLDVIFSASDKILTTYMNLCEGKAHLDLDESGDVKEKLKEKGFPDIDVKRFLKKLPTILRHVLTPDIEEPDLDVFKSMFSVPEKIPSPKEKQPKGRDTGNGLGSIDLLGCVLEPIPDGFRVRAKEDFQENSPPLKVAMAYFDGTANPFWEEFDFQIGDLDVSSEGCSLLEKKDNLVVIGQCKKDFSLEIRGFDSHRELTVSVDPYHA